MREELGADALILSNRPLASGGIEIMAVADGDVSALAQSLATAAVNRHAPEAAESLAAFTGSGLATPATAQAKPLNSAVMGHALARTYAVPVEPLDEPEHIPLRRGLWSRLLHFNQTILPQTLNSHRLLRKLGLPR